MRNPVWSSSCVTPAGTSNELDVQNEWEENTTHTHNSFSNECCLCITMDQLICASLFSRTHYWYEVGICFVRVFFPFILDIKFVGRTSRGHTGGMSHRISHPPSFCGACLHFFSREKDSAIPFPRRPWSRILCTNDLIILHPLGIFILFFVFLVRKIPFAWIELTSQRVRRLHGYSELPGRLVYVCWKYRRLYL